MSFSRLPGAGSQSGGNGYGGHNGFLGHVPTPSRSDQNPNLAHSFSHDAYDNGSLSIGSGGLPSRPERSMRRLPVSPASPARLGSAGVNGRFPDGRVGGSDMYSSNHVGERGEANGAVGYSLIAVHNSPGSKSRRMMEQLNIPAGAPSPNSPSSPDRFVNQVSSSNSQVNMASSSQLPSQRHSRHRANSADSSSSAGSSTGSLRGGRGENLEASSAPPVLTDALSAFSAAGARRADGRRGGLADQGYDTAVAKAKAKSSALSPNEYPDTPAFREIENALRKVKSEWPVLMYGTTAVEGEADEEKDFDPVTLALNLLDPANSASSNSLPAFLRLKAELDRAISGTLTNSNSSYRAYESSISTHNSTFQSLATSQKQVGGLKKTLSEAREKLEGKGREGLVGMYNRMSHLEEMVKILDEIDNFCSIPDRLEALLSEKRFLTAVVLLVRSLKTINKPEMMEVGALTDLRNWLVLQEGVLLEILIEELHNHLYLKSFYCDARYKAYTRGQITLPLVDFGDDAEVTSGPSHLETSFHTSGRSTARLPRMSKLQRYLNDLSLRPSHNPLLNEPVDDVLNSPLGEDASGILLGGSFSAPGTSSSEGGGIGEKGIGAVGSKSHRPRQKNPELDSFAYIESLIESLACLGKLGIGLDAVSQRVQSEMFSLVEATVEEVDERNNFAKQSASGARPVSTYLPSGNSGTAQSRSSFANFASLSLSHASTNRSSVLRLTASESSELEANVETLKDLFWTLYSKLDAVLQGFRVAYEAAMRIAERRDFKDFATAKASSGHLMFSLIEVWKPVQQEVRSLLHDYLTDDQSGVVTARNPIVSVNEVLRLGRPRDHSKQIFKFADSDFKASAKILKLHEDELHRALKVAVPGLIVDGAAPSSQSLVSLIVTDDRYGGARSGIAGTHKALVQADAFNVSILFGPTLAFLERVREIMPGGLMGDDDQGAGAFGGFLDDFVLRTFLPQLEEKVTSVFLQAVGGLESFQEDPGYKKVSRRPVVKSVTNIMLLISSLCSMLRATPFHRENYSHLIVSVIHQFYQRCQDRFKDLASRDTTPASAIPLETRIKPAVSLKTSATWAEMPEVNECLDELWAIPAADTLGIKEALKKETRIELDKKRNSLIQTDDLITPSKRLLALGTLYTSLDWFVLQLSSLKTSSEAVPSGMGGAFEDRSSSPTMDPENGSDENSANFSLPLTKEMAQPFEALLKSYRQLANLVLFTLRMEVRLRAMHYLDKATRDGVYQLAEDVAEPDPSVVDLNSDLAECDDCAAQTLAAPERRYIFEGLSLLMDQLLISNARHIRLANQHGLSKMMRNILALQQNLKNIGDTPLEVDFDRSRKFWEVFGKGPKAMLDMIRSGAISYDFEDYKSLLNLMCGIDQSSKDAVAETTAPASGGDRSRRMYNEYLIDLFALDVEG